MKEKILNHQFSFTNVKISGKEILKHPLFTGSFLMIVGSNFANFVAYIYHLIIGRLLGPSSYGDLVAILSLIGLLTSIFIFFSIVIVKFISVSKGKELENAFNWFTRLGIISGLVVSFLILLIAGNISSFLHIDRKIILLISPVFFFSVLSLVWRAVLQGLLKFKELVTVVSAEMIIRFILSLVFIFIGLSIFGATLGILVGAGLSLYLNKLLLKQFKIKLKGITYNQNVRVLKYAAPVAVASLATNSFFSTDVLLVKHFFTAEEAGLYSALSNLGKIILYGTAPVAAVMFPMISKKYEEGKSYGRIIFMSFVFTAVISFSILVVYLFLPNLAIEILYGKKYLGGAGHLFYFGLYMSIFSLDSLLLSFFLSRERFKPVLMVVLASIVQVIGIWYFHDTIREVIFISIFSAVSLLVLLAVYFWHEKSPTRFRRE